MAVYRRSNRTRYVLAVLVLAALTLVTIDARSNGGGVLSSVRARVDDVFSPLQRATHAALRPFGNFLTGAADYGSLKAENQRLRQQLAALQAQAAQVQAEKDGYEQVFANQHLSYPASAPTIQADIIDNSASNFENTVTIDKGTHSGIAPGQPVLAAGGLVGTVEQASADQATIIILTDPTFRVGVSLPGGNIGTAEGLGRTDPMKVTVDTTSLAAPKVKKGDVLFTSGLDSEKFPKYIPVGRITDVVSSPTDPEPEITLAPMINLSSLSYVDVLLWSPQ